MRERRTARSFSTNPPRGDVPYGRRIAGRSPSTARLDQDGELNENYDPIELGPTPDAG